MYLYIYIIILLQIQNLTNQSFFEVKNLNTREVHRMYIEKTFNELKKKIRNTFELENPIKYVYYCDNDEDIYVKTEEDYEIMILSKANKKLIKLYFN